MRILTILGSLLLVATVAEQAHAGDKPFELGVGLMGGAGVVGLSKPSDLTVAQVGNLTLQDTAYPGFFGATGGIGLMIDARVKGAIGVEVDLYYALSDKGAGDITVGQTAVTSGTKYSINIGQSALHVPVLLKGTLPFGSVRPFLAIGPDFVLPGSGGVTITPTPPNGGTSFAASADNYILWTAALGAEIRLPVPSLDIRIPFSLRAGMNFDTSDKVTDRRSTELASNGQTILKNTYKSEWQYQGLFTLGAAIYF